METNSTADESTPAAPGDDIGENSAAWADENRSEQPVEGSPTHVEDEVAALNELATRAQFGRLPAADEERAIALLKDALLTGKKGVSKAVETLPRLPWIVGVRAVEAAWGTMKPTAKTQLAKGLAEDESDATRRVRLSLARALFKQDVPVALKIAVGVAKEMWDKATGALSQKNAQIFANVFIGKAKPWVAQLPLADLKPGDAELLVHCAVLAVFSLPHPPGTQLAILKWAAEGGHLEKLHESAVEIVARSVARWSAKWQSALRNEIPELPAQIRGAPESLTTESPETDQAESLSVAPVPAAETEPHEPDSAVEEPDAREQIKERPVYEPRPQRPATAREPSRDPGQRGGHRKERPVYQPRNAGVAGQSFNLPETLQQIELHVQWLRTELNTAQARLRQHDEEGRRGKRVVERGTTVIEGEPTMEELARLNQQLEARIAELQCRIDDLLADAEDRAASIGAHSGEQVTNVDTQLRALLALKLQSNFSDFVALEQESPSVVVQQHYKSLLREVFEVLRHEGIPLNE
jgi:hypothetical protein